MEEGAIYRGKGEYYGVVNGELFKLLSGKTVEELPNWLEECANYEGSFKRLLDLVKAGGKLKVSEERLCQIKKRIFKNDVFRVLKGGNKNG